MCYYKSRYHFVINENTKCSLPINHVHCFPKKKNCLDSRIFFYCYYCDETLLRGNESIIL